MSPPYKVAVVGCGLIGRRRAGVAAASPQSVVAVVADVDAGAARATAAEHGCTWSTSWESVLEDPGIDIVVVATPNSFLARISIAALQANKDVLLEKPMGCNAAEASRIADTAARIGRRVKVGFNHRYHPAISQAHRLFKSGTIGRLINIRGRYGHGGRPGYEREWRGNAQLAGGGELTDQGIHLLDLIYWFLGMPIEVFAYLQTAVWPIFPLEDNGFGLLRFADGAIASMHTSWTQWKNLFSFEVIGTDGSLIIEGLGKSYGIERLTVVRRRSEGGIPEVKEEQFAGEDISWEREWSDFIAGLNGAAYYGTPQDGVAVMTMLDALYRSAREGVPCKPEGNR